MGLEPWVTSLKELGENAPLGLRRSHQTQALREAWPLRLHPPALCTMVSNQRITSTTPTEPRLCKSLCKPNGQCSAGWLYAGYISNGRCNGRDKPRHFGDDCSDSCPANYEPRCDTYGSVVVVGSSPCVHLIHTSAVMARICVQ